MGNDRWAKQIGKMLRERRESLGLSQADIATRIGTSQQNYQKFETGKTLIGLEYLLVLPQILGCRITDLLPDEVVTDYDRRRAADPRLQEVIQQRSVSPASLSGPDRKRPASHKKAGPVNRLL